MIHLHLHLCNLSDYDYGRYKGFKFRKTLTIKNVSTPDDKLAYFRQKPRVFKMLFLYLSVCVQIKPFINHNLSYLFPI
jgi:hypothetical protein